MPNSLFKTGGLSKSSAVSSLICDWNEQKLVFLEIVKSAEGITLQNFFEIPGFQPGEEGIKQLTAASGRMKFSSRRLRLSVKGTGVVIRFIQFPKMKFEDLKSAISYEAEKYIPFKADEVIFDYAVLDPEITLSSGMKGMNLMLVAAKKDDIYPLVQTFTSAQFEVDLVGINALAFLNAIEFFYPEDFSRCVAALEIESNLCTFAIARGKKPRLIRDISFGVSDLIKKLKRSLATQDEAEIMKHLSSADEKSPFMESLKEACRNLISDIKISLDYYLNHAHSPEPPIKIFAAGEGAQFSALLKVLSEMLGVSIEVVDCASKIKTDANHAGWIQTNRMFLPILLGLGVKNEEP